MKKVEINEKVQYWLDLAAEDLIIADTMLKNKHYLYVGFMCHQIIEKSLKAVVMQEINEIPPKIHQLVKLAQKARVHVKMTEDQRELLRELNPLNIEARYPEYKSQIAQKLTEEYCAKLIKETEELLCWIKKQL